MEWMRHVMDIVNNVSSCGDQVLVEKLQNAPRTRTSPIGPWVWATAPGAAQRLLDGYPPENIPMVEVEPADWRWELLIGEDSGCLVRWPQSSRFFCAGLPTAAGRKRPRNPRCFLHPINSPPNLQLPTSFQHNPFFVFVFAFVFALFIGNSFSPGCKL